jgi:tetratricopeptide (TPR) repeat protein
MRARSLLNRFPLLILIAPLLTGCVRVIDEPPVGGGFCEDAPCFTALGWQAYEAGRYDEAFLFAQAIQQDSSYAEAYMGLGWCHIEHGFIGLAQQDFQQAIELDSDLIAAYAGNAYALAANGNAGDAVTMAEIVLQTGGEAYVFEHNAEVNGPSLRILLASIYFRLGDFGSAQNQVDLVAPGNGLNPQSRTYVHDLMQLIIDLGGQV